MNYLIDTDILIDWLRGKKSTASFFRETKGVFYYSSITKKELLSGCSHTSEAVQVQSDGMGKEIGSCDEKPETF